MKRFKLNTFRKLDSNFQLLFFMGTVCPIEVYGCMSQALCNLHVFCRHGSHGYHLHHVLVIVCNTIILLYIIVYS